MVQKWSTNLGPWQYELGIKNNTLFEENDSIHIKLRLFSPGRGNMFVEDDFIKFEGFISYWSTKDIINNCAEFIKDLHAELQKEVVSLVKASVPPPTNTRPQKVPT